MYWQQDQQRQQQGMQGRGNNMRQGMSQGWGAQNAAGNRPSLLDMSGNLRNDPGMRNTPSGFGANNRNQNLTGAGRGGSVGVGSVGGGGGGGGSGGLLPSPPPMGFHSSNRDMLGQIDNDIDELVAAKVRLQQAMLSAAAVESEDRQPMQQQGFQFQDRGDEQRDFQQPQQQFRPQQDRFLASAAPMGRNEGGDFRAGDFRGGDLRGNDLRGRDFRGGDFKGGNFGSGDFKGGDFKSGNFRSGDFKGGDFRGRDFRSENVRGDNFRGNNFRGDNFRDDNVRGNNFRGDNFRGDNFRGGDFKGGDSRGSPGMREGRAGGVGRGSGGGGVGGGGGGGAAGRERRSNSRGDSHSQQRKRNSSEIYDPARPTEDDMTVTSIGRPVDDLQVTIRQQSRGRAVTDDGGPARKRNMQSSSVQKSSATAEDEGDSSWFCHVCSVHCRNIKLYQNHMTSTSHLDAMQKIREVATFQSDQARARLKAQNYLSKLDGSSGTGGGGAGAGAGVGGGVGGSGGNMGNRNAPTDQRSTQRFCRECYRYYRGDRFDHIKTDAHKDAKKKFKPHCSACNLSFKTSQKYVQHCKEESHKKQRDKQLKDKPSNDEENFVTVDAVGFDDDAELEEEAAQMEVEAEGKNKPPETTSQDKEEEEAVVILEGGESSANAEVASAPPSEVVGDPAAAVPDKGAAAAATATAGNDKKPSAPVDPSKAEAAPSLEAGSKISLSEPVQAPPTEVPSPIEIASSLDESSSANVKTTLTTDSQSSSAPSPNKTSPRVSEKPEMVVEEESKKPPPSEAKAAEVQVHSDQVGLSQAGRDGGEATVTSKSPDLGAGSAAAKQDEATETAEATKKPLTYEDLATLSYDPNKSVGEEYLVPVTGYFCKLCHKFLTSSKANQTHCRGKSHFQALKAELKKKETEDGATTDQNGDQMKK